MCRRRRRSYSQISFAPPLRRHPHPDPPPQRAGEGEERPHSAKSICAPMAAQLIVRATCRGLPPPLPLLRGRVGVGESREHESSGLISLRLLRHGLLPPSLIEFRLTRSSLPLLAMTAQTSDSNFKQREDMRSCSRGADSARGLHQLHPPSQTEGAGKAGCRLHPRSCAQKAHEWTTGSTGSLRLSLRDSVTAYFELSPVTGLSCHRRLAD
jgi:hypothetical protein